MTETGKDIQEQIAELTATLKDLPKNGEKAKEVEREIKTLRKNFKKVTRNASKNRKARRYNEETYDAENEEFEAAY